MLKEIGVRTNKRLEMVNITREVQAFLDAAKAKAGTVVVFVPHTTAGVTK
ncbi:MAG: YjbQ family protein [Elusimicrobia bacterium]|nr:YjbQ family protein [Elusimicrobiota bacterium]